MSRPLQSIDKWQRRVRALLDSLGWAPARAARCFRVSRGTVDAWLTTDASGHREPSRLERCAVIYVLQQNLSSRTWKARQPRRSGPHGNTKYDWSSVDWTSSVLEISAQLGAPPQTVRNHINRHRKHTLHH